MYVQNLLINQILRSKVRDHEHILLHFSEHFRPNAACSLCCLQSDDIITCIISGTEVKKVTQILHIYYVTIVTIRSITEIDVGVTVILQVQTSSIVLSATIVTLVITVSRLI